MGHEQTISFEKPLGVEWLQVMYQHYDNYTQNNLHLINTFAAYQVERLMKNN